MELSLPPQNRSKNHNKLSIIKEQKKRLRERIEKLQMKQKDSTDGRQAINYQQNMVRLLQKKKILQQQKQKEQLIKKMQNQYIERQKQMEREKRLEKLQNQKRMIELQVGIKRLVFEGTKEKVRGMNSEQLLMRAMLRDGQDPKKIRSYTSKQNVRRDFQAFLQKQHREEYKQKWDIYELNQQRLKVFEQKQQTLMREVLLKQLISKEKDSEINVLKLDKKQLEDMLEQYGIDISDYMHTIMKQQIISALPEITKQAKQNIKLHEQRKRLDENQQRKLEKQKFKLKQFLLLQDEQSVKISQQLVLEIIDNFVFKYEKRFGRFQIDQFAKAINQKENRYEEIMLESDDYEYAKLITLRMLEDMHEQFTEQAAEQVVLLHDFAHEKTEQCFQWMFPKGIKIDKKFKDIKTIEIKLNFTNESTNVKEQINKEDYLKKYEDYHNSIFNVDKLTTQIINEINILELEKQYFNRISIKVHGERQGPSNQYHILYDRQLYVLTNEAIHNAKNIKIKIQKLGISDKLQILNYQKFHNFWLVHDNQKVSLYSPWGLQLFKNNIGERINNICGRITSMQIFPICNILGQICSIMLGFEKGQILKYNLNMNRISNTQTSLSFYKPLLPQNKTGHEPSFPLNKKDTIVIQSQKMIQNTEIHQFRQFFQHHTDEIIGINFYKHNTFITVDKYLKCALWQYDESVGSKCYTPTYTFQFIPSYLVYRELQNSRTTNIYPGKIHDNSQQLYEKWMKGEGFLRKQLFNNPKKSIAYYRTNDEKQQKGEFPLWVVQYDQPKKKVLKINETYYGSMKGNMQARKTKIWRQYLMLLCIRDHIIKQQLRTIKLYGWDIEERKMRSICIQFDIFRNQNSAQFEVLDNMLIGVDTQLVAIASSGRIIIFSLITGQLLRNLSETEYLENPKCASYFFNEITAKRSVLGAATKTHTMEISLNDHNGTNNKKQINQMIKEVSKKYLNLL